MTFGPGNPRVVTWPKEHGVTNCAWVAKDDDGWISLAQDSDEIAMPPAAARAILALVGDE